MSPSAFLTELEAVNSILEACEEAPVSSLETSGLRPLDQAKASLVEASRLVQSVGWKFNTEEGFPLVRDVDGYIRLPVNTIRVDVDADSSVGPVQRGLSLYDAKGHTSVFTKDLTGTVTFFLPWDELPPPARHAITVKAARIMQGRTPVSDSTYKFTDDDVRDAALALQQHESEEGDASMLNDSWSTLGVVAGIRGIY